MIVTSNTDFIFVDFGIFATHPKVNMRRSFFGKEQVVYFALRNEDYINILVNGSGEWQIDMNGVLGIPVTSVNGVIPTDNENLLELLFTL